MDFLAIAIARGIRRENLVPAFAAAIEGGFKRLEITMNTYGAAEMITYASQSFGEAAIIGAGTVVTLDQCREAVKAGAKFIVSPIIDVPVIEFCVKMDIPVYPGALTPTEIHRAWEAGAAMVKVFPVSLVGGPSYIREIKGPFNEIKLLACGGVTPENVAQYRQSGADGIAAGGQLFKKEWIDRGEFGKIRDKAREYIVNA